MFPGAPSGSGYILAKAYNHLLCACAEGPGTTTHFSTLHPGVLAQLPPFVQGELPFSFSEASGVDKGDLEAARNMIVKLDGNAQADNINQQKAEAHMNQEYSYLHWHLAMSGMGNKVAQPRVRDFGAIDDMTKFSAMLVWAPWLSMVVQAYQQPITETQLRLMTSLT